MPPRLSLSELYTLKDKKNNLKYNTFDYIIDNFIKKIKNTATIGGMNIFYEIPFYIYGKPLYKINDCITYVVDSLKKNGLFVLLLPEPNTNMIYISWDPKDISKKKLLE